VTYRSTFDIIYSCNFAFPVVFPDPIFPSIETIKQADVAGGADDDNFVVHEDNEAEAPIFLTDIVYNVIIYLYL
jgi:hypothetical protein